MQPGLARAVPLGIVGFIVGGLLAILIRLAQGLDPNPVEPNAFVGPAMVLGAFISAGFFVWGMGAFDPRMSVHGEHAHAEASESAETPLSLLAGFTWQVTFWVLLFCIVIAAVALVPFGPNIRSVNPNEGNVAAVGFVAAGDVYKAVREFIQTATGIIIPPLAENLAQVQLSYLVIFVFFIAWTMFSLFLVAGLIGFLLDYFGRARKNPDAVGIPWRAIIFIGLVASLLPLPLVVPTKVVPMAMLMPAYILPQLLLFIVYRRPIWLLLLLPALPLPMLVPNVSLSEMPNVMFALVGAAILMIAFSIISYALPERFRNTMLRIDLTLITLAVVFYTVSVTINDFWQLWFLLFIAVVSLGLILPVWFLKSIISPSVWQKFADVDWLMVVPQFAGWLAEVLRNGLPKFLGQR